MIFQKPAKVALSFIAINSLILAMLVVTAQAQQHGDKQELRSKLLQQVLTDFKDLRGCMEREEGGLDAAQEKMTVEAVDLNHDGVPEYDVELGGPCVDRGTVNRSIFIYRKAGDGFELILDDGDGYGIEPLKTMTNGYRDLRTTARETLATQSLTTYKFDGKQYREAKRILVNVETGESKPASRRLQFKRGSSETTVQGKVSLALPDTYLVRARAGQVMTVKLTASRKAVRVLVMSPTTTSLNADRARDWTGVLPESGDYIIVIDTDEGTSSYSMTISIK